MAAPQRLPIWQAMPCSASMEYWVIHQPGNGSGGTAPPQCLRSNNLVNHLQAVKAGIGVGTLPRIEGDRHPDLQLCITMMEDASQPIWIVMRRDARKDKAVSALADLVIERVRAMRHAFAGA